MAISPGDERERFPWFHDNAQLKAEDLRRFVAAARRTARQHALNFLLDPEDTDGTTRPIKENGIVLWGLDTSIEMRQGQPYIIVSAGAALLPGTAGEDERYTFVSVPGLSRNISPEVPLSGSIVLPISIGAKQMGMDVEGQHIRELVPGTNQHIYRQQSLPRTTMTAPMVHIGNLLPTRVWIADVTLYANGDLPTLEDRRRWLFPDFKTLGAYDGTEGWPQNLRMAQGDMGRGYRGLRTAWKRLVGRVSELYQVANNVMNSAGELRETLRVSVGSAMQFAQVEGLAKWRLRVGDGRQVQADGVRVINADHETEIDPSNYRNDPDGLKLNASNVVRAVAVVRWVPGVGDQPEAWSWRGQNVESISRDNATGVFTIVFTDGILNNASLSSDDQDSIRYRINHAGFKVGPVVSFAKAVRVRDNVNAITVFIGSDSEAYDCGFALEVLGPIEPGSIWRNLSE